MPAVIDQNTLNIRITWLEIERGKLEHKQAEADDETLAAIQREIEGLSAKIEECEDWMKILNQDPGWGDLVNVDGERLPKLPTFKSLEQKKRQVEDPMAWERDLNYEQTARARDFNMKNNAQEAVFVMDGTGPVAAWLEEGKTEEEILELLRGGQWDKT